MPFSWPVAAPHRQTTPSSAVAIRLLSGEIASARGGFRAGGEAPQPLSGGRVPDVDVILAAGYPGGGSSDAVASHEQPAVAAERGGVMSALTNSSRTICPEGNSSNRSVRLSPVRRVACCPRRTRADWGDPGRRRTAAVCRRRRRRGSHSRVPSFSRNTLLATNRGRGVVARSYSPGRAARPLDGRSIDPESDSRTRNAGGLPPEVLHSRNS